MVKLPVAEIQSLIDRKIAPPAPARPRPVDRARAALVNGNYDEVFEERGNRNSKAARWRCSKGRRHWRKFRKSPKPEWNARALAAFQRAMALADPKSATESEAWTDAALSAASVLHDLAGTPKPKRCCGSASESANPTGSSNLRESRSSSTIYRCC